MLHQEILDVQKMEILKMQQEMHQHIVGLFGKKATLESQLYDGLMTN